MLIESHPNISTSLGHEKFMYFFHAAMCEIDYLSAQIPLRQPSGNPIYNKLWQQVDAGKMRYADMYRAQWQVSPEGEVSLRPGAREALQSGLLDMAAKLARESNFTNDILLGPFRQELWNSSRPAVNFSSHYMGHLHNVHGVNGIFMCPDAIVQNAAARLADTSVTGFSSSPQISHQLHDLGFHHEQIVETGVVAPTFIQNAALQRLKVHQYNQLHPREQHHKALITIGASGPEIYQAVQALDTFIGKRIPTTVICGVGTHNHSRIMRNLAEIRQQNNPDLVEIVGGTPDWSRHDEVNEVLNRFADPTYTMVASRPNEMTVLSAAHRIFHIGLSPIQSHEVRMQNLMTRQSNYFRTSYIPFHPQAFHPPIEPYNTFTYANYWMPLVRNPHEFMAIRGVAQTLTLD